jgi:hypothetical protein
MNFCHINVYQFQHWALLFKSGGVDDIPDGDDVVIEDQEGEEVLGRQLPANDNVTAQVVVILRLPCGVCATVTHVRTLQLLSYMCSNSYPCSDTLVTQLHLHQ